VNGPHRALLVLALPLAAAAQDPLDGFAAAAEAARAATTPVAQQHLATAALDQFLRAAPALPARQRLLPEGLEMAVLAGRPALARELRATADGTVPQASLLQWSMVALVRCDDLAAFAGELPQVRSLHPEVAAAVLAAEEGRLLPLADAALRAGDTANGRAVFAALAGLEPQQGWRLANLGLCLRNLGELEAAEAAYRRARALTPDDPQIESDFGLFLRATGRPAAALAAFRRSYELDAAPSGGQPGSGPAITNLLHHEALQPGTLDADPLPAGRRALALRPDAALLRRLVLDVTLQRLVGR
jgi:tetratricopeptide (TPR) repeat protein